MNVFFDQNLSPVLASTLDGFVRHREHQACHISDCPGLPNGRRSTDLEWIDFLRSDPEFWIFLTGDKRLMKNRAERAALRSAGLHGFILAPAFQKIPVHQQASTLIWKWPEIEQIVQLTAAPAMYEIPAGRSGKLQSLPV